MNDSDLLSLWKSTIGPTHSLVHTVCQVIALVALILLTILYIYVRIHS